jgi:hypothetical protein
VSLAQAIESGDFVTTRLVAFLGGRTVRFALSSLDGDIVAAFYITSLARGADVPYEEVRT